MCGIYVVFGDRHYRESFNMNYENIKPRGPDETIVSDETDKFLVFHRLAINGVVNGSQPMTIGNYTLLCNGEIYNYKQLAKKYEYNLKTGSDCEIIIHLYKLFGIERTLQELDGEFAFILIDNEGNVVHFARDPLGVKPLYMRVNKDERNNIQMLELSSSVSGMSSGSSVSPSVSAILANPQHVIPRVLYTYDMNRCILSSQTYKSFSYLTYENGNNVRFGKITKNHIYDCLINGVYKRITNSQRPIGFFLSGGIDSCSVLSIALDSGLLKSPTDVFTFAFHKNAPDALAAGVMVDWLKKKYGDDCIKWHLVIDSTENGVSNIPTVIRHLETYDTTTIRASTPMYMLSKYISEKTDVKVVISGEGSDELFGGYLYNNYSPNKWAFRAEIISALDNLYLYDVLRADRVTAACGLEIRPPFLDKNLIDSVLSYKHLQHSSKNSKQILRDILEKNNVLPNEILHGRKEAFSDAVGLDWQDSVELYATKYVRDHNDSINKLLYQLVKNTASKSKKDVQTISKKEIEKSNTELYFTNEFVKLFGYKSMNLLPKLWLPNQDWVFTGSEPSARALDIY